MTVLFVDTSALIKRYVAETGSVWLQGLLEPAAGNVTFIARITIVEMTAALTRRERGASLSATDATRARIAFRADLGSEYQIVELTEALIERASALAEIHGLRGYDAVQLAAALEVRDLCLTSGVPSMMLISSDTELNAAASTETLPTDDPNAHP